ncbi:hypothetical protein [Falsochrobactrum shanghaiense]|nr:hypothetical protein [Falsochrobactrum shanghaiense]
MSAIARLSGLFLTLINMILQVMFSIQWLPFAIYSEMAGPAREIPIA